MSLVDIHVELPQRSVSFSIKVAGSCTVLQIKEHIARQCPGEPRVDGQRLIYKGRILTDSESIADLWQQNENRVLHLAVSPWAWSSGQTNPRTTALVSSPPDATADASANTSASAAHLRLFSALSQQNHSITSSNQLSFITYLHYKALETLCPTSYTPSRDPGPSAKERAKATLAARYHRWPSVFDEDWPMSADTESGVKYQPAFVDGKLYLKLVDSSRQPTAAQRHALKVLTYTFALLSTPSDPVLDNTNYLQAQARLAPQAPQVYDFRAQNNGNNVPRPRAIRVRVIRLRAILTPLILLCLRTMFLLYFFSPTRKPFFGLLLGCWVLYEAWGAIRGALGNGDDPAEPRRGVQNQARRRPNANPIARQEEQDNPVNRQYPDLLNWTNMTTSDLILNKLSRLNFSNELIYIYSREGTRNGQQPNFFERARIFIILFILTLHPAIWNRRRTALKLREGSLRTEANIIRRAQEDANNNNDTNLQEQRPEVDAVRVQIRERHEARPRWVREYVERIQAAESLDDI